MDNRPHFISSSWPRRISANRKSPTALAPSGDTAESRPTNKNAPRAFSFVSIRWISVHRQAEGLLAATEACETHSDPQQSDPSAVTDNTTPTGKNQPHTSRSRPELRLHPMAPTSEKQTNKRTRALASSNSFECSAMHAFTRSTNLFEMSCDSPPSKSHASTSEGFRKSPWSEPGSQRRTSTVGPKSKPPLRSRGTSLDLRDGSTRRARRQLH